jgi:hypothetical protein
MWSKITGESTNALRYILSGLSTVRVSNQRQFFLPADMHGVYVHVCFKSQIAKSHIPVPCFLTQTMSKKTPISKDIRFLFRSCSEVLRGRWTVDFSFEL